MKIRKANIEDAHAIHDMHMRSIKENCADSYSPEAISAWGNREYNEEIRVRSILDDYVLVLEGNSGIAGYMHLSYQGEVKALYLAPEAIGQGYGKKLLDLAEGKASDKGVRSLYLHATLNAENFYTRHGFKADGPMDKIEINGQWIECQPMKKDLG